MIELALLAFKGAVMGLGSLGGQRLVKHAWSRFRRARSSDTPDQFRT